MKTFRIFAAALMLTAASLPAFAQKWGNNPEDSVQCIMNTSVYSEMYKMKDYAGAYDAWRQVVNKCPQSSKNLYIRGVNIMYAKINAAKTEEERAALVNELMALYDTRIKYFGEVGDNLARKAHDLEQLKGVKAVEEYYPIYAEAVRQGGDKLDAEYAYLYFNAAVAYVKAGKSDATLVIDAYDKASDILDKAMRNEPEKAEKIGGYVTNVEVGFAPYASCDQLIGIYSKKFEDNANDVDLLKKITNIMRKKGCTDSELFFKASAKLHELEPSPNTAYLMAQMCYNKKQYGEAVKYASEAVQGLDEDDDKYKAYLLLGLSHDGQNAYGAARSDYYKAAEIRPNSGEPYLLIAQLYGSNARSVNDGMGGASAYWAAVDKAVRARNIDSSPANVEAANKIISSYSAHFPKQETAFMLDLIDGHSFVVPGWIGESTTIRTRK